MSNDLPTTGQNKPLFSLPFGRAVIEHLTCGMAVRLIPDRDLEAQPEAYLVCSPVSFSITDSTAEGR